jgi:hypothetical protein
MFLSAIVVRKVKSIIGLSMLSVTLYLTRLE